MTTKSLWEMWIGYLKKAHYPLSVIQEAEQQMCDALSAGELKNEKEW